MKEQYRRLQPQIEKAVRDVCQNTEFINGKPVKELEEKLADYVGVQHCITCANGTDALLLALMAWNIGPGDAVFVPDFTFFASGEAPAFLEAVPVFVDVDETTFNMDPASLERAVRKVLAEGRLTPKAVIAVDLFGLPADYEKIRAVTNAFGLYLLEDGAQGFGGMAKGKRACSFGDISTTSFFPAKPLGCYGDGGAVFTDNAQWAALLRSLCVHGKGSDKYDNVRIGMNSRLDTIQAAILKIKLDAFISGELQNVNRVAEEYTACLDDLVGVTKPQEGFLSSWAQYTIRLKDGGERYRIINGLKERGIPSAVYYNKPMHEQKAFGESKGTEADCPVTEGLCGRVLSLPMHPYLERPDIVKIAGSIREILC